MSKYRNVPCQVGAEKYRSQKEMRRHQELLLLQKAGKICSLSREVPFELAPSVVIQGRKRPAMKYIADFVYYDLEGRERTVEDCKGVRTTAYNIKRHLMMSVRGIEILET